MLKAFRRAKCAGQERSAIRLPASSRHTGCRRQTETSALQKQRAPYHVGWTPKAQDLLFPNDITSQDRAWSLAGAMCGGQLAGPGEKARACFGRHREGSGRETGRGGKAMERVCSSAGHQCGRPREAHSSWASFEGLRRRCHKKVPPRGQEA